MLDIKQQETGRGPCIEAAREQTLICINDLRRDPRWPELSAEAQACGVSSMLCAPLWISERTLGALTLYAAQPAAFSPHDERIIEVKQVRQEATKPDTGTTFLLAEKGLYLIRRPALESAEAHSRSGSPTLATLSGQLRSVGHLNYCPKGDNGIAIEPPLNIRTLQY